MKSLRQRFAQPGIVRIMGAHNALGAKLVEQVGFDGVWASGLEISASHGVPDANILTMFEVLQAAQSMADAVQIPVVADCDTGFGNSSNVIHMVRKFEAAGVAAVCIEDKLFPKVNSLVAGRQDLAPVAEFVGKIMAAKNAQRGSEFMMIARVEALIAGWGMDEALRRAHAYKEAGADAILMHSKAKDVKPIADFLRAWGDEAPVVVVPTMFYGVSAHELETLGVKMVIYANHGLRASITAMEQTFREILASGSTAPVEDRIAPLKQVFDLQGMPEFQRDEDAYVRSDLERTRAIIPAAGDHMNEYSMEHISADIPMAMLDIGGKPLLQRQVEVLSHFHVGDITVVGGYKREKIMVDGVRVTENSEWQTTGDMRSILCAATEYDGRTLVVLSDILFDDDVLGKLLKSDRDITMLVDRTFGSRKHDPDRKVDLVVLESPTPTTHRSISLRSASRVNQVGMRLPLDQATCEYAGLTLFSKKGFQLLTGVYREMANSDNGRPFHEAGSIDKAWHTDVLQELIDRGHEVDCIQISSGWLEIHSFKDYKLACTVVAS